MPVQPGQTLASRYRIDAQIGKGGTATVYRGYDPAMDRVVAIKVFPDDAVTGEEAARQFATELRVIGQLEHPHILPIYDCGHHGRIPFIVMRYADRGSLAGEMEQGRLPLDRVLDLADQIARGLSYAHQRGMIHRDIKPQNILVEASGDVYIGDFSLAVLLTSSQAFDAQTTTGTAYYMSPEQCKGALVDVRSDIYSLGAMLYEMCTGHRPHEGPNWAEIVVKVLSEDPPLPRTYNPDLLEHTQDVILKAMARNPEERFATALELSAALRDSLHSD
ncbi:MAG: serine/threonine protein kinase [Chloroflexi bacterium]|nr:serine/threonine protein kinase [Chloroflexota bacterium]